MSPLAEPVRMWLQRHEVTIPTGIVTLPGDLSLPETPVGMVVFAHGSGSSRLSPRNLQVARSLNSAGLGTLLFDLLTETEAGDRANVFDIRLLARRLGAAVGWLGTQEETADLPLGIFGASTGAAAALWAAAEIGAVGAVVSRGGRPDLAAARLSLVRAPTLLIVGGADEVVLALNRGALAELSQCRHELAVVPGATHLFEEPGALERVAGLARHWFSRHLAPPPWPAAHGGSGL